MKKGSKMIDFAQKIFVRFKCNAIAAECPILISDGNIPVIEIVPSIRHRFFRFTIFNKESSQEYFQINFTHEQYEQGVLFCLQFKKNSVSIKSISGEHAFFEYFTGNAQNFNVTCDEDIEISGVISDIIGLDAKISYSDVMHTRGRVALDRSKNFSVSDISKFQMSLYIDRRLIGQIPLSDVVCTVNGEYNDIFFMHDRNKMISDGMVVNLSIVSPFGEEILCFTEVKSYFIGKILCCNETTISGVALNRNLRDRPVAVDIFVNDRYVGSTLADQSLAQSRQGYKVIENGRFEYKFAIPLFLSPGCRVDVSVKYTDTGSELENSPWKLNTIVSSEDILRQLYQNDIYEISS
ncbi:hypothetical protein [Methylobacterium tarhaniae]|uniref:hypothetical protein n=1 Tax=Methylobacterium tarhaniae TaxID=1187852 RepID=UPI003D065385